MKRKNAIVLVLATLCLTVTLFSVIPVMSVQPYDPWKDVNDDGVIDAKDYQAVKSRIPSIGTPLDKAYLAYDSDWLDISDKAGQYSEIVHNLNTTDLIVEINGKATVDGGIHQRYFGGSDFVAGWNKTYGGTAEDTLPSVIQTNDGGYLLSGYTRSFGSGQTDFWSLKIDSGGNVQWNKTYGGPYREEAVCSIQTSDGGYATVGNKDVSGYENFDVWLVKTDSFGVAQWNKTYGGGAYDFAGGHKCLVQTSDGGYAIGGRTRSWAVGQEDSLLIKTDSGGNMQWYKIYGGYDYEGCIPMIQTADGGYALAGWQNPHYMYLVKTNSSGDMQWSNTYGGTGYENGFDLIQTIEGGFAIAGSTTSYGAGGIDFYVVKTDSSGVMQWNKTYGGSGDDEAHSLIQMSDGEFVISGWTKSYGAGLADCWIVWTDASGNMQSSKTYGGTSDDYGYGRLFQSEDGGLMMACMTQSLGAGNFDWWLIKTDAAGNAFDSFKYGLALVDSTPDTITLFRGTDDEYWNYVRVCLWTPK
jgi:hypothetical protein